MTSKIIEKIILVIWLLVAGTAFSAVLPEDRADALYHAYVGGGMQIDGPSILVRKSFLDKFSVSANWYTDSVTGASIDVLANASPYTEFREQYSLGVDYLVNKTTISTSFTNSSENDYEADTWYLGISQDFFGDLSTLAIGYARGNDVVGNSTDPSFAEAASRQNFKLDWTQVVTKNWILSAGIEGVTDQGYLNNPYRVVRFVDPSAGKGFSTQTEVYPETRTSTAVSIRSLYYLPYRAAIKFEARAFSDTWGIEAKNFELAYIHPYGDHWLLEGKVRTYSQGQADFYSDLFPFINAQNFMARDKEMSQMSDIALGFAIGYELEFEPTSFFKRFSVNLHMDYMRFEYDNFRNVLVHDTNPGVFAAGDEPLYEFDAIVTRFFVSVWY